MMKYVLLFTLLFSPQALAENAADEWVRDNAKWENTKLAGKVSDYTVVFLAASSLAVQDSWKQAGAVAGMHVGAALLNQGVKHSVARCRPDGSDCVSFYSGHTSLAFASAGAICLSENTEMCVGALVLAGGVGYLRIAANKHWGTDVLVGAGVGYACGRYVPTIIVVF